jgi:hypothetical protein
VNPNAAIGRVANRRTHHSTARRYPTPANASSPVTPAAIVRMICKSLNPASAYQRHKKKAANRAAKWF